MARMVKNTVSTVLSCNIITKYEDNTSVTNSIKVDDVVENFKYKDGDDIKTISGRISDINFVCNRITRVNITKPVNSFSSDVKVGSISIDSSEDYESNVVSISSSDILGYESESNIVSASTVVTGKVTMDMEYTDGSIVNQDIEIGDVLKDSVILTSPKKTDITGDFKIVAWSYNVKNAIPTINGAYLKSLKDGRVANYQFERFISFTEATSVNVSNNSSLIDINKALTSSETGEVYAQLDVDVTIPKRADGKITTTLIGAGKTLNIDLNGHELSTQAYAFYVSGGVLNISDTSGNGKIECTYASNSGAYPAIFVTTNGECNMSGGIIDTTNVDTSEGGHNWLYGVACSGNGIFNMTGGKMIIGGAAGISITNGTASGGGAKFTIGGNANITSVGSAAVYLADNKSVVVKDNAVIEGGMVLRMGDITIEGNAVINGHKSTDPIYPLGKQVVLSGVGSPESAILALTGCYNSSLGNDLNITIDSNAKVNGYIKNAIDIATLNTLYDQKVVVDIKNKNSITAVEKKWNVYSHDELSAMATAEGKTLTAEAKTTDLTIKVNGVIEYPVV